MNDTIVQLCECGDLGCSKCLELPLEVALRMPPDLKSAAQVQLVADGCDPDPGFVLAESGPGYRIYRSG